MSLFHGYKPLIQENDLVIVQVTHNDKKVLKIKDGEITQTSKGAIRHSGLINYPYGSKYTATLGDVYVLFPTPELWTLSLPHRTQIIYSHDISLIISELDLEMNGAVLESGTGSGSLTHALARAVLPEGNVHTCEFHLQRVKAARQEFSEHGLDKTVKVYYRDVCQEKNSSNNCESEIIENGFPKIEKNKPTACILDVPKPWLELKSAYNTMDHKSSKPLRFCCFSPCIEQVQRTIVFAYQTWKSLVREMKTVEFNVKTCNVKTNKLPFADLGLDEQQEENFGYKMDLGERRVSLSGYEACRSGADDKEVGGKTSERMDDSDKNEKTEKFFHHSYSSAGAKVYGHTGYLTFFSIIPDIEGTLDAGVLF